MKKIVFLLLTMITTNVFAELTYTDIRDSYYDSYTNENRGNYSKAIKDLENVYETYKDTYTVNYRLGWLYYLDKNYVNSIQHLEKALSLVPMSIEVMNTMMIVYAAQLEWTKVEEIGNLALKENYYDTTSNYWYSIALTNQKRYSDAIKVSRKMLYIYPTSTTFLRQLGINLYFNEEYEEAYSTFESVIILNPEETVALEYYEKMKNFK